MNTGEVQAYRAAMATLVTLGSAARRLGDSCLSAAASFRTFAQATTNVQRRRRAMREIGRWKFGPKSGAIRHRQQREATR